MSGAIARVSAEISRMWIAVARVRISAEGMRARLFRVRRALTRCAGASSVRALFQNHR